MKMLNCVTSYNRYYYLKNMIESLKEFFPYGDTIIVDDQSNNPNTLKYLDELNANGMTVLSTIVKKNSSLYKGGLYQGMDIGMNYAIDNDYEYINFLQDDMQCMWYDEHLVDRVESLFAYSDKVLSVCSEFYKKITRYRLVRDIEYYTEIDAYDRKPLAIPAVSIVSVKRFIKLGMKFGDFGKEKFFNEPLFRNGYISLTPRLPLFAWIPWPKTTTHGITTGSEKPPRKQYYYHPISGKLLKKFKERSLHQVPFVEDYCQTWGYLAIKPYWFTQFSMQYIKMLKMNIEAGIFMFPHV